MGTPESLKLLSRWSVKPIVTKPCSDHFEFGRFRPLLMCSPKTLASVISRFEMLLFPPQPPPAILRSSAPMDQRHYHGPYNPGYKTLAFPPPYADNHGFSQYPYNPGYPTTSLDPTAVLPTQSEYEWNIRNGLRQTPTSFPMIPFVSPTSPHELKDNYLFVNAQPIGFYSTQPQVSLSAASSLKAPA